jgi:hypothetical protein
VVSSALLGMRRGRRGGWSEEEDDDDVDEDEPLVPGEVAETVCLFK